MQRTRRVAYGPLLFFDTNVIGKLKSKSPPELKRFWAWIHAQHRYAITPLVLVEVMKSLRDNPEEHLEDVRRELSALRGPGKPIMLPLVGVFLGRTLFGIQGDHPYASARVMAEVLFAGRRLKRVALHQDGRVLLIWSQEDDPIVLDYLIDPIAEGEASMFAALDATKAKRAAPLEPEEWARRTLTGLELAATAENCRILADACKGAYALQRFLWTQAVRDYNPRKNRDDWMDLQLLLYLAYPRAVFVSCEKKLPNRIAGSGQENRVRAFADLWEESQA